MCTFLWQNKSLGKLIHLWCFIEIAIIIANDLSTKWNSNLINGTCRSQSRNLSFLFWRIGGHSLSSDRSWPFKFSSRPISHAFMNRVWLMSFTCVVSEFVRDKMSFYAATKQCLSNVIAPTVVIAFYKGLESFFFNFT